MEKTIMIKNLDKYKKHITQENGELRYRGYLIRAERRTVVDRVRITNVVIDYRDDEGYEGNTVKKFAKKGESFDDWLVYFKEDKPVHYSGLGFWLEDVFESIDRRCQAEEEK